MELAACPWGTQLACQPQSWDYAWHASRESGGWFDEFSDEEILATQKLLAEKEGIFCEPASAISVAGALRREDWL